MESNVKTELMILTVWSAVMLQNGMLPTSYITNVGNKNMQVYSVGTEVKNTVLPDFLEEDLLKNEIKLLTNTSEIEQKETQGSGDSCIYVADSLFCIANIITTV